MYSNLGFRSVNGVRRGTRVNDANSTVEERCAWRSSTWLDRVHQSIGFRLAVNGVLMGGANSNAAMYVRCGGYRNADGTRWNAHTTVRGFRFCEGCNEGVKL